MPAPLNIFNQFTLGFYNLENFYHPDETGILVNALPKHLEEQWTINRYRKKVQKVGKVINQIGRQFSNTPPVLMGLAEISGTRVLNDLINGSHLRDQQYDFVYCTQPDDRGMDIGLLYQPKNFEILDVEAIPVRPLNQHGSIESTRNILSVTGKLYRTTLTIYVNHWPSRREGLEITEPYRITAAKTLADHCHKKGQDYPMVVLGDFNDDPNNQSIKSCIESLGLKNITDELLSRNRGTHNYRSKWHLFDQILISESLIELESAELRLIEARIFSDDMLQHTKGKRRGQPSRTFSQFLYKGGISDHFPVYAIFQKNQP
jgi:endonuclease/exonuclease/phosphatase family metal-dependent hydrolase